MRSFKAPDGNVYLGIRSVVYDSWIMWNDVLPDPQDEQPLMTKDIYENITELGLRIHKLHQSMPNYKQMTESPFNFVLWWDPDDDDDDWSRGKVCRFMINDYSAEDILFYSKSKKGNKLFNIEFSRSNIYKSQKFLSKNELNLIKKNLRKYLQW